MSHTLPEQHGRAAAESAVAEDVFGSYNTDGGNKTEIDLLADDGAVGATDGGGGALLLVRPPPHVTVHAACHDNGQQQHPSTIASTFGSTKALVLVVGLLGLVGVVASIFVSVNPTHTTSTLTPTPSKSGDVDTTTDKCNSTDANASCITSNGTAVAKTTAPTAPTAPPAPTFPSTAANDIGATGLYTTTNVAAATTLPTLQTRMKQAAAVLEEIVLSNDLAALQEFVVAKLTGKLGVELPDGQSTQFIRERSTATSRGLAASFLQTVLQALGLEPEVQQYSASGVNVYAWLNATAAPSESGAAGAGNDHSSEDASTNTVRTHVHAHP